MSDYRYPWPSSALTASDMELLFRAREGSAKRIPITELVALAVRTVYGTDGADVPEPTNPSCRKEAA